jgi:hypothetical protein
MSENYDKQKMLETLVDPDVSTILAELEHEDKKLSFLIDKLQMTEAEIREKLSYVIQHGFVKIQNGDDAIFSVDKERLDKIMQSDENFSGVVDGLTKLDSFLN